MPTHHLKKEGEQQKKEEDVCLFGKTDFRDQMKKFGIKLDDRRRHMYVIGKTGMGKTTMLENMILQDIHKGHGVGLVDPHGDFAENIVDYIPSHRINDVVYINPADREHPIGFNVLEIQNDEQKDLVASSLMGIFQKIWPDVWSSRMEYILNNTLLALLHYPQKTTLLGINRMLGDKSYRDKIVSKIKDPVVKSFWEDEFAGYSERYRTKAVAAIQNKIGQFLSSNLIRNIVGQVSSTINTRELMDSGKIMIMNLSKGKVGEDNMRLLGGMFITKLQLSAMSRVDTPEHLRKDFMLYVDEFQNFATPSFASMLSEARKYRLSLVMAHQYIEQLSEEVRDAVFGNVGTLVSFRIGAADAEFLEQEFSPVFMQQDLVNLSKYHIFLKLMIDGVASQPFSAKTLPPLGNTTGVRDKVIKVSRERYGRDREKVVEKIAKWSGKNIDHVQAEEEQQDDKNSDDESQNDSENENQDQEQEDKQQDQQEDTNQNNHEAQNTQSTEELSLNELKNKQDN